jgi:integrase
VDVLVDVWVPSPSKPRDRVLTRDELRALLAGARAGDPHVYVFVVLLICTSARHTAILDLTWDRVNFLDRTITYDESRPIDAMSKSWQKGRATVPMPELAFAALQEAFTGKQCSHVVEHGGRRLKSVRTGFARAAERAGIKGKVTPHTIRHTVATLLREGGLSNDRVARILGHTDERTTNLISTHTGVEYIRDAVGIIDDLDLTRH